MRFLVSHYDPWSCRLRFLAFGSHVCAPTKMPALVTLLDEPPRMLPPLQLPRLPQHALTRQLGLSSSALELVAGFLRWVEAPKAPIPIYLLRATGTDPFGEPSGTRWIELPDSFALSPIERLLLRAVYEHYLS